jgi:L,D-peptidoglycan transpeptidase YkuD (ErfK/YbiS/YcfS/YnhG family)
VTPHDLVVTAQGARFLGRGFPVAIGRGGIVPPGDKREGDGATPAGVHRIVGVLYRSDRLAAPCVGAVPVGPRDLWSDDPADADYNRPVRAPHGHSHERLARGDRLYDIVLVTDWNRRGAPGRGSAIFVHAWRGPRYPTAGCVAFRPDHLRWIVRRLGPSARLVVRG